MCLGRKQQICIILHHDLLVRFTQEIDGLLGVAGIIMKITMKWIIPSFPTALAPVQGITMPPDGGIFLDLPDAFGQLIHALRAMFFFKNSVYPRVCGSIWLDMLRYE